MRTIYLIFFSLSFQLHAFNLSYFTSHITLSEGLSIKRQFYTESYSTKYKITLSGYYLLTKSMLAGTNSRNNKFKPDPTIPITYRAQNSDYSKSGFDKGHLTPSADMKITKQAQEDTFWLSNIVPQYPTFNRITWEHMESQCRDIVKKYGLAYIIFGTIVLPVHRTIGKNNISVPAYMYRIVVLPNTNSICFLYKNVANISDQTNRSITTVKHLEQMAGIPFFQRFDEKFKRKVSEYRVQQ